MSPRKRSFFERLTGVVRFEDEENPRTINDEKEENTSHEFQTDTNEYFSEQQQEPEDAELQVDMYETPNSLMIRAFVAGITPEELDITITRDMVTIRGKRVQHNQVTDNNRYHYQDLYWGSFSRTIELPEEIEVEEAEAIERNGMLEINLPKINKDRKAKVRVKMG